MRKKCPHGRQRSKCKECGGSSVCPHNRVRNTCKECGGSSVCHHGRQRNTCKECGGSQICEHNRQRSTCKECGGSQICEHNRIRNTCKECGGGSICEHNRLRSQCSLCRPLGSYKKYAQHEKQKYGGLPADFMSFETYEGLIKQPCVWCGRTPEEANGMGVDRRDNTLGHVKGNLDPSCVRCNMIRKAIPRDEFSAFIGDVTRFNGNLSTASDNPLPGL